MYKTLLALILCICMLAPVGQADGLEWMDVAENAILPDESSFREYPASVVLGEQAYDLEQLLTALLGDDYLTVERSEYDYADNYRSSGGEDPWQWRTVSVWDDDASFQYYNPWITGERGGEYEAPRMTAIPEDNIERCIALLDGLTPDEWLGQVNKNRWICDRWDYSDRWMTDEEYLSFCCEQKAQYFTFNHTTRDGLPIWSDKVMARVGADGLDTLTISWHEFTESTEQLSPMPLETALEMANSTRSAHCTLLSAELVYSNWLTGNDTHHLSWLLTTDAGNYIVDCVLNKHQCDHYEY